MTDTCGTCGAKLQRGTRRCYSCGYEVKRRDGSAGFNMMRCSGPRGCNHTAGIGFFETGDPQQPYRCPKCKKIHTFEIFRREW